MRRAARLTLTGLALVALAACDAPPPREAAEAEVEAGEQETTVFDDTIQTQDRARAVEDLTLEGERCPGHAPPSRSSM